MSANSPSFKMTMPSEVAQRVKQACLRFKQAWKKGPRPLIEDYLGASAGEEQAALLPMLIGVEIAYRQKRGEEPTIEEYLRRFPALKREALQRVFATASAANHSASSEQEIRTAAQAAFGLCSSQKIGPYKLLEQIGEGGMGTVWMAEQVEPVRRIVALKVIKPGMDSSQVLARFEAERQALALMDHPNIARVLDAGTIGSPHAPLAGKGASSEGVGRPFFVMELVKGIPITKYCDENHLNPRERLELFVPVCHAIQHAHQKGIIHRDIKPSNVLVACYDGQPVPKVIDFGVAKATGQKLTERTLFTGFGAMIGTLEYMSPEQACFNALDVDTRSDIYGLGVLLYELLTGTTPLARNRLKAAALEEALRMIREEEPPKPSTRLSNSKATLASVAALRKTEPVKLTKMLRGEPDWIVMKALEKDRSRRYETANALASDIHRYLHDETVQACPPSTWYRMRKFARRNKTGLRIALAAAGVLLLAVVGVTWVLWDRAAGEAERLVEKEQSANAALAKAKQVRDRANGYVILGNDFRTKNQWDEAIAAYRKATVIDPTFALAYSNLGYALEGKNQWDGAIAAYKEAIRLDPTLRIGAVLARIEKVMEVDKTIAKYKEAIRLNPRDALAYRNLGDALMEKNPALLDALARERRLVEAIAAYKEAIRLNPNDALAHRGLGDTLMQDSRKITDDALAQKRQLVEAIAAYKEAVRLNPDDALAHHNLGILLEQNHQMDEAIAAYKEEIRLKPDSAPLYWNLGMKLAGGSLWTALACRGSIDEALVAFREAVRLNPKNPSWQNGLGWMLVNFADPRYRDPKSALVHAKNALQLQPNGVISGDHWNVLGTAYYRLGDWKAALEALNKVTAIRKRNDDHCFFLAMTYWQLGEKDLARLWYYKGLSAVPEARDDMFYLVSVQGYRAEAADLLGIQAPPAPSKDAPLPKKKAP